MIDKEKIIVVWGGENLLSSSITYFLAGKESWQVVCISTREALDDLILTVASAHPDIVIIHQVDQNGLPNIPLQFLREYPSIKVITLSLDNNAMDVYSKQKIMVMQASDLITAIEAEP